MLQNIRDNSQGIIAKIIVGFIVITFALFGIDSIVSLGTSADAPVTVNGVEVSEAEIYRAVEGQKNRLRQQFGSQFDENVFGEGFLRQSAVDQIIEQKVALTQAESLGAFASPKIIDQEILNTPSFQEEGVFSKERFKLLLRQNGYSPLAYRKVVAESQLVSQVQLGTGLSDQALPYEIQRQGALNAEQRSYRYQEVAIDDFKASVQLAEEDVLEYYEANKQRFQTQETVVVDYVVLNKADIVSEQEVSEEDIDALYLAYQDEQSGLEERQSSHVLIEVNDDRSEAEAQVLAEEVSAKAQSGQDFAALAQEFSDDIGSKASGGDLGFNTKGGFVEEFDDALFAMAKGDISSPIQTEFGFHVIKLIDIRSPEIASLDDKRAELTEQVLAGYAAEKFAEVAEALAATAYENESIDDLVEVSELNLVKQTTDAFTRGGGSGFAANPAITKAAFSEEVLEDRQLSEVLEISEDQIAVLGLAQHNLPKTKALDLVREEVETTLIAQKAKALAKEEAEKIQQSIVNGSTLSGQWIDVVATFDDAAEAPSELNAAVFALPKAEGESALSATTAGFAVAALKEVIAATAEAKVEDQGLSQGKSTESFYSYRQWAKSHSEIERAGS